MKDLTRLAYFPLFSLCLIKGKNSKNTSITVCLAIQILLSPRSLPFKVFPFSSPSFVKQLLPRDQREALVLKRKSRGILSLKSNRSTVAIFCRSSSLFISSLTKKPLFLVVQEAALETGCFHTFSLQEMATSYSWMKLLVLSSGLFFQSVYCTEAWGWKRRWRRREKKESQGKSMIPAVCVSQFKLGRKRRGIRQRLEPGKNSTNFPVQEERMRWEMNVCLYLQ